MWESVTRKPSRQVRMLGVEPATPVMLGAYNQTMCTVKGEDLFWQKSQWQTLQHNVNDNWKQVLCLQFCQQNKILFRRWKFIARALVSEGMWSVSGDGLGLWLGKEYVS